MDESALTVVLAVCLVALFFSNSALPLLGAVFMVPLASKVPFPL